MNKSFTEVIKDFFSFPFRLNFLLSAFSVILIAAIWPSVVQGIYPFAIDPISLHAYAFLNIAGGAGFAGFILTAIPEWTHDNRRLIPYSFSLFILWLSGALSTIFAPILAGIAFGLFWLSLSTIVLLFSIKARDHNIISVMVLLFTIAVLNLCYVYEPSLFWLRQIAHIFIAGVALITFRIGKSIGNTALENTALAACRFIPNPFYKNLSLWFIYLFVASEIFLDNPLSSAWMSVAVGMAILGRLRDWHYRVLLTQYYIRWYYLTLATIGVGYVWLGATTILSLGSITPALHLIMIGGFLLMMMQVFTIAGISHSSLALYYPGLSRLAIACVFAAALSRSFGALSRDYFVLFVFHLPGLLLALAFGIYIPIFYRIFINNPGLAVRPRVKD
ncbi:MAG: NnrS family protein [Alcaligenaceae bacterium]|nr:NnrS family protein [Alcaligenaceae bacterium]